MDINQYIYEQQRYDENLTKFLTENINKNEVDFLNFEINKTEEKIYYYENITVEQIKDELRIQFRIKLSLPDSTPELIENFLNHEVLRFKGAIPSKTNYLKKCLTDFNIRLNRFNGITQKEKESILDLSDSKGTEKIIMLKQLGVLDFLNSKEPFNTSINSLASAISGITGEKQTSVYPMINPILNPTNKQKNNPLNTKKTVNKVNQKLISIGFNPSK